jgi:hypothetical protein
VLEAQHRGEEGEDVHVLERRNAPRCSHLRAGRIPAFENVHVFPFLVALLGLEHVPRSDGDARILAPYLRAPPRD